LLGLSEKQIGSSLSLFCLIVRGHDGNLFLLLPPNHKEAIRLKIIPVIDIQNGIAVHAVKGNRSQYQPLKSTLCPSAEPVAVALALKACGFGALYVADLDAILDKSDNAAILQGIAEGGSKLMVDAGTSDAKSVQRLLEHGVSQVVIGTETLENLEFVKDAVERFSKQRIVVSLDLNGRKVLSQSEAASSMVPQELAAELEKLGVTELIVLDLARVGSDQGPDFALLKNLQSSLSLKLLVGGGARDLGDLQKLKEMGVYGVLMATALHSGKTSMEQLRSFDLLS
jgi:phosphoribosylformimino-5-aminoimidazole carboxamide ribotide isomerase